MVNLLYTELLKLKRSKMFLLSIIGAAVAPLMVAAAMFVQMKTKEPYLVAQFSVLMSNTSIYAVLVIGVPLYGVITAYLYNREYAEDTMKNLLTIPVSRVALLMSKWIMLLGWIMLLTLSAWALAIIFGSLGQFAGLTPQFVLNSLSNYVVAGLLLFLLSTPIILITLVLKSFVPAIIVTIIITLVNVMLATSEHRGLFPWTAALDIANGTLEAKYPPEYSYISIAATFIICLGLAIGYFKKIDIH
ncbi:ABC transporter permease [Paenibacillus sp. FSL R5-0623]|uniref:ABC transporter permease n=1 Tax=Paenibacillus TaxID=44249 RepID=UPI00096E3474|nr:MULTISPECIES: ABC transporter permease [Paenibacillus]MBY0115565.1 ABC transporter permease [Paenibacillus xylanexedens]OMF61905.1 bacitracin ABC transporter permease [Paenibacillus sp. FSL R5-0765]